jgi:hypothetical protein
MCRPTDPEPAPAAGGEPVASAAAAALGQRLRRRGIDLDPARVVAVERVNRQALHGAILLARFPRTGAAAERVAGWERELAAIADRPVLFNPNLHMAEASLTDPPHLPRPLRRTDLAHVDFARFLAATGAASPFTVRFVRIYLDPDGNLVLAGRVDGPELLDLRRRWREAGLWIKGHPVLAGASCTCHATLTHLPLRLWRGLDGTAVARFRSWLDRNAALEPPLDVEVRALAIVCMARRSGWSTLGDDIDLALAPGGGPAIDGDGIVAEVARRFAAAPPAREVG